MNDVPKKHRRWPVFVLPIVFLIAIIAYSAYWHILAKELHKGALAWIDDQRAAGYDMSYASTKMSGYPWRFRLDVETPAIKDPNTGWDWAGEKLTLVMQTYNFSHVISYLPGKHVLTAPDETKYEMDLEGAQGSFRWNDENVQRVSLVARSVVMNAPDGIYEIQGPNFHMSPMPGATEDMRIQTGFDKILLPRERADAPWLGREIGPVAAPIAVKHGMTVLSVSGKPKDIISALDPSVITPLTEINWGPLKVKAKTAGITIDSKNRPEGVLQLRLENIPALRRALNDAGQLDQESQAVLALAEGMMQSETAFVPITFKDGKAKFAFQDLGEVGPIF